uniref:NADH-ubiquinone oxidoreductase chain 3 n=1 Tax=Lype phaeopa TaxID=623209 RepID=A0A7D7ADC1_9NEOP|nr:NADH dehydrogenase subunit 3 [Lype phaeopa]
MFFLIMITIIMIILPFIMFILSMIISKKLNLNREKTSPFECGFNPKYSPRIPFSLHFFSITILFLIFDIEITILLPFFITKSLIYNLNYMITLIIFMMILILGIFHEWNQAILNWKI